MVACRLLNRADLIAGMEALGYRLVDSWRERRAPEGFAFPGDPREWERTKYATANLTPLGKKLLGLDSWGN